MKTILAVLLMSFISLPALACEGFEQDMAVLEKIVLAPTRTPVPPDVTITR